MNMKMISMQALVVIMCATDVMGQNPDGDGTGSGSGSGSGDLNHRRGSGVGDPHYMTFGNFMIVSIVFRKNPLLNTSFLIYLGRSSPFGWFFDILIFHYPTYIYIYCGSFVVVACQ